MPPRYQQGQLASPSVGTPGLDQSAGVVEQQIAKSADAMRGAADTANFQTLRQAEQDFNTARGMFFYMAQQQAQQSRQQQALERAEQREQRNLEVNLRRLDEDGLLDTMIGDLKTTYAAEPQKAVEEFKNRLPVLRQEFQRRNGDDQTRLRMMLPAQRTAERGALSSLQSWATQATTDNLKNRLALLPEELNAKTDGLSGPLNDQLLAFQKNLGGVDVIYQNLRNSVLTQGDRDEVELKRLKMGTAATNHFVEHLLAQTPDGEAGLKHIETVRTMVKSAQMFDIPLSSDDQRKQLEHLNTMHNAHEQEVITGIQGDTTIKILDANKLKADLYNAANNPKALTLIARQVQSRLNGLEQQIEIVSREPDSKTRNAKLAGLKQEQNAFIGELGLDLKLSRSFDQLQRTLTSFAQSQVKFQQGQIRFQQSQLLFLQGQENKEAAKAHVAGVERFNGDWAKVQTDLAAALAQPQGPKQQQEINRITTESLPLLNNAVSAGTIKADDYGKYLGQLRDKIEKADLVKSVKGWFGFGPDSTVRLKGKEKDKALASARAQFGAIVQSEQVNFQSLQTSQEQLRALTTNKAEKAVVSQYLSANMPRLLGSDSYKKLTPDKQASIRSRFVREALTRYRSGTLQ